jgi:hypothetical protein
MEPTAQPTIISGSTTNNQASAPPQRTGSPATPQPTPFRTPVPTVTLPETTPTQLPSLGYEAQGSIIGAAVAITIMASTAIATLIIKKRQPSSNEEEEF